MKVPQFLVELLQRFATKNHSFFKWIQTVSGVVAIVAFLPDLLNYLDISSPSWLEVLHSKAVKIGALTAIVMAQLPNEQPKK
jgi:xanthine/uracil permease